ncbi:hypothetical protein RSOL_469340 [Rhizoctonia solani AG-3 Rhs1AP]|uniref:Uncharacterized protein n=1 Tax=Rhizoctonia solani AG-3 Rhs1AP TaxID=1086054 RepID=X8JIE1_9AGAM|nr:hypothetical protein RSOL_469340 [Rhizoctonia solani AG-3 Rhs1AP]
MRWYWMDGCHCLRVRPNLH